MGNNQGIIILGLFSAGLIIFSGYSLLSNISPYLSVSELIKGGNAYNVQVNGTIVNKSSEFFKEENITRFLLTDGISEVEVIYTGLIHNQDGIEVVVRGDYIDGKLYATEILNKCHTEYTTEKE
jgi:cytochrome c-type biogenesis protein CcmE